MLVAGSLITRRDPQVSAFFASVDPVDGAVRLGGQRKLPLVKHAQQRLVGQRGVASGVATQELYMPVMEAPIAYYADKHSLEDRKRLEGKGLR